MNFSDDELNTFKEGAGQLIREGLRDLLGITPADKEGTVDAPVPYEPVRPAVVAPTPVRPAASPLTEKPLGSEPAPHLRRPFSVMTDAELRAELKRREDVAVAAEYPWPPELSPAQQSQLCSLLAVPGAKPPPAFCGPSMAAAQDVEAKLVNVMVYAADAGLSNGTIMYLFGLALVRHALLHNEPVNIAALCNRVETALEDSVTAYTPRVP